MRGKSLETFLGFCRVLSAPSAALGRACASCFVVQVLCWLRGRHETSMRQGLYREHEQYRESRS